MFFVARSNFRTGLNISGICISLFTFSILSELLSKICVDGSLQVFMIDGRGVPNHIAPKSIQNMSKIQEKKKADFILLSCFVDLIDSSILGIFPLILIVFSASGCALAQFTRLGKKIPPFFGKNGQSRTHVPADSFAGNAGK